MGKSTIFYPPDEDSNEGDDNDDDNQTDSKNTNNDQTGVISLSNCDSLDKIQNIIETNQSAKYITA